MVYLNFPFFHVGNKKKGVYLSAMNEIHSWCKSTSLRCCQWAPGDLHPLRTPACNPLWASQPREQLLRLSSDQGRETRCLQRCHPASCLIGSGAKHCLWVPCGDAPMHDTTHKALGTVKKKKKKSNQALAADCEMCLGWTHVLEETLHLNAGLLQLVNQEKPFPFDVLQRSARGQIPSASSSCWALIPSASPATPSIGLKYGWKS